MCGTCGCSNTDRITIYRPGQQETQHKDLRSHHHTHEDHHHNLNPKEEKIIQIEQNILHENDLLAERNRGYFEAKNIFAINLVSAPGSGKTALLEKTLTQLKNTIPFFVIEGDQQTMNDANRIDAIGVPVVQVNTGNACHLDASMINNAVKKLNPVNDSMLFIENVGNLVCPSLFDLGENKRVVIISVTEGEDKAIKYPNMFHSSDLCIINKIDLLPYVNFDLDKAKDYALQVNHHLEILELSVTSGEGLSDWYDWLKNVGHPALHGTLN